MLPGDSDPTWCASPPFTPPHPHPHLTSTPPFSPSLPPQGLETLDGNIRAGLPFDLGSQAANQAFGGMTRAVQERAGAAQHMPEQLYAAGGLGGAAALCTSAPFFADACSCGYAL